MFDVREDFHIDAALLSSFHGASKEDLQALAQLYENPTNDDEIELYIYLYTFMFLKWRNIKTLEKAIQQAEEWAAAATASHPEHYRRFNILVITRSCTRRPGATARDIEYVLATGL